MYFSGQGKLYVGVRNASGFPVSMDWVGNVSKFEVALETTSVEHTDSYSGQRLTDLILETAKKATMSATFEDWDVNNLARVLRGTVVNGATTAVVDEVVPTIGNVAINAVTEAAPFRFLTVGKNLGATVTMKDSTGAPITLTRNTHFRVLSEAAGLIEVYDAPAGPLVEPLLISYTPGARKEVGLFTQPAKEYYLLFDGVNTADGNKPVLAEFYKTQFNPAQSIPLINEGLGTFEVTGAVLLDSLRSGNIGTNPLGQFGKLTQNTVA